MPLTSRERRALIARGHQLKADIVLPADAVTDAVVAHVQGAFGKRDLLKVRIATETSKECDALAAELAARVPCELVQRVGRVALLYGAPEADALDVIGA